MITSENQSRNEDNDSSTSIQILRVQPVSKAGPGTDSASGPVSASTTNWNQSSIDRSVLLAAHKFASLRDIVAVLTEAGDDAIRDTFNALATDEAILGTSENDIKKQSLIAGFYNASLLYAAALTRVGQVTALALSIADAPDRATVVNNLRTVSRFLCLLLLLLLLFVVVTIIITISMIARVLTVFTLLTGIVNDCRLSSAASAAVQGLARAASSAGSRGTRVYHAKVRGTSDVRGSE
jgi:hypothetical protein